MASHNYTDVQLLQLLLRACIEVRKAPKYSYSFGICGFLTDFLGDKLAGGRGWRYLTTAQWRTLIFLRDTVFLNSIARHWPKYSGNSAFPVPSPNHYGPAQAYNTFNLWSGTYGANRIELLDFTIDSLKIALRGTK